MISFLLLLGVSVVLFGGAARWLERAAEPPPDPPADTAEPTSPREVRPATPLPRRLRRHHRIPQHTDPPLTDAELIQVANTWPHLVSAYYRESHHR